MNFNQHPFGSRFSICVDSTAIQGIWVEESNMPASTIDIAFFYCYFAGSFRELKRGNMNFVFRYLMNMININRFVQRISLVFKGGILLKSKNKSKMNGTGEKRFRLYHGILLPVARFTFTKLTAVKCHSSVQL